MKKILLLTITLVSARLPGMERAEPTFSWEQLFPELKKEIFQHVVNAQSINQAISFLQNIRVVNRQLYEQIAYNKATIFGILNSLLKNFSGSEVAIARRLNTPLAQEWLKTVNPWASFTVIPVNNQQFVIAETYIENGNIDSLKQWLEKGYDPKSKFNGRTLSSYAVEHGSLEALELINKYDSDIFSLQNVIGLLRTASLALHNPIDNELKKKIFNIYNFLTIKLEEHVSFIESLAITQEISDEVRNRFDASNG